MEKVENIQKETKEEQLKRLKRKKLIKYTFVVVAHILGSALLLLLGLLWQNDFLTLMAWTNSLWLTFVMVFFIGWIMFIYNQNIISSFVHSLKTFGLMFVGKRPAKKYYEVKMEVEENQIPKSYLFITFGFSLLILIPAIITLILAL